MTFPPNNFEPWVTVCVARRTILQDSAQILAVQGWGLVIPWVKTKLFTARLDRLFLINQSSATGLLWWQVQPRLHQLKTHWSPLVHIPDIIILSSSED